MKMPYLHDNLAKRSNKVHRCTAELESITTNSLLTAGQKKSITFALQGIKHLLIGDCRKQRELLALAQKIAKV